MRCAVFARMWMRACSQLLLQVDTLRPEIRRVDPLHANTSRGSLSIANRTQPVAVYLALLKSYKHMGSALLR